MPPPGYPDMRGGGGIPRYVSDPPPQVLLTSLPPPTPPPPSPSRPQFRPLTHDLMHHLVDALQYRVSRPST